MKTINQIVEFATSTDAVGFENYCTENRIMVEWLDVTLTDLNEGFYNVYLPIYAMGVMYYNGKVQGFN